MTTTEEQLKKLLEYFRDVMNVEREDMETLKTRDVSKLKKPGTDQIESKRNKQSRNILDTFYKNLGGK